MHEKIEKNDQELITLFIRLIPNIHILHSSLTKAKKNYRSLLLQQAHLFPS